MEEILEVRPVCFDMIISLRKKPERYVRYPVDLVLWVFLCSEVEPGHLKTGRLQGV